MRKYSTAPSISSGFVRMRVSIGRASVTPTAPSSTPATTQITSALNTVSRVSSSCPAPRNCAMRTFTPLPSPISSPVNSVTRIVVEPTAPSAIAPENLPTTATSARLNSTCKSWDAISGSENSNMFFQSDPVVMAFDRAGDADIAAPFTAAKNVVQQRSILPPPRVVKRDREKKKHRRIKSFGAFWWA